MNFFFLWPWNANSVFCHYIKQVNMVCADWPEFVEPSCGSWWCWGVHVPVRQLHHHPVFVWAACAIWLEPLSLVSLPTAFMNKVSGLCGNFNGDPNDDFTMPSNTQAASATEFGQSWKVHNLTLDEGCSDDNVTTIGCDAEALKQWQGGNYCGLLMMAPFTPVILLLTQVYTFRTACLMFVWQLGRETTYARSSRSMQVHVNMVGSS